MTFLSLIHFSRSFSSFSFFRFFFHASLSSCCAALFCCFSFFFPFLPEYMIIRFTFASAISALLCTLFSRKVCYSIFLVHPLPDSHSPPFVTIDSTTSRTQTCVYVYWYYTHHLNLFQCWFITKRTCESFRVAVGDWKAQNWPTDEAREGWTLNH